MQLYSDFLHHLKILVSKQINDEYKNSFDKLVKTQILKEIEKFKVDEIPSNLILNDLPPLLPFIVFDNGTVIVV